MFTMDQYADLFGDTAEKMTKNTEAMTRMWMDMASKMMMTGMSMTQGLTPPEAGREMRSTMFKTMSSYFEEYLRSPQFLDMSRQAMDGILSFRKQLDQFLTQFHHEMQGVARQDIDSLQHALRQMERRLLDRIEEMEEHMEELSERLGRVEALAGEGGTHSRRQPTAQKPEAAAAETRKRRWE